MNNSDSGIVTLTGHLPVDQTVRKIEETLQAKGIKLFAVIDHRAAAAQ
jgi:uncharacterized protein (DUF302 family)